ncbi:MAG: anthranilate phosphoribosyltransferase [Glaciecola sp.]|jgi:anthranilate phosphoribosyltransferase
MNHDINTVLDTLYRQADLDQMQVNTIFGAVMRGELDDITLTALLIALKIKGETPVEIAGAASAMVEHATAFQRPDYAFADIVGTGGDGHNTINISSAAAIVAASCGLPVAKHGNRSVSSKSGSADLFAAFGMQLDMSPQTAKACLDEHGLAFLFAPVYHAGVKHAMPVRTTLQTRTLFNILGPLANPARPTHSVMGVYTPELLLPYAHTLQLMGHEQAMIVHGAGLDEFALHGPSQVVQIKGEQLSEYAVEPSDFGLANYPLDALVGGEPHENKAHIEAVFKGEGQAAHVAAIAMNAGALLHLAGIAKSFSQGADMAQEAMAQAKPLQTITAAALTSTENP